MNYTPEQLRLCADAKEAIDKGLPAEQWNARYTRGEWREYGGAFYLDDGWLYRPKSAPKTRPWSKPDDVPIGICYIRDKNSPSGFSTILSANSYGFVRVVSRYGYSNSAEINRASWSYCDEFEYSLDRKTWHSCEVTE